MKLEAAVVVLLACSQSDCQPVCGVHEAAAPMTEPDPPQIADLGARCYGDVFVPPNAPGYDPQLVDFDGDAVDDILSTSTGELRLQLGRSSGGFEVGVAIAMLPEQADVVIADVDGDGDTDVLAIAGHELTVYLRGDDGTLQAGPAQHFTPSGGDEVDVRITALDSAGDRPAALAVGSFGNVVLFELDATGTFGETEMILERGEIVDLFRVEVDATPGAELAILADGVLWIYEPDDGMLQENLVMAQDVPPVVVDVDDDGRDEIAVLERDAIVVYRVAPDTADEVLRFEADVHGDVAFALGHLDDDGAIDAVSASPADYHEFEGDSCEGGFAVTWPGRLELLLANGTRAEADHELWDSESAHMLLFDLDGDGWGDIVDGPSVIPARSCEEI